MVGPGNEKAVVRRKMFGVDIVAWVKHIQRGTGGDGLVWNIRERASIF